MWLIKAIVLLLLFIIFVQDYKDRFVHWFLYPLMGILTFVLFFTEVAFPLVRISLIINIAFIGVLLVVCILYAKFKLGQKITEVIGLGDILFFFCISFSFASVSFIVLFVFALLFALVLHLILKNKNKNKTVPLAGYMSLFFAAVYIISFFTESKFLYAL